VGPSPLDIMAAHEALELMQDVQTQRGGQKPILRFVPSKLVSRTVLSQDLPQTLATLGAPVLPGITQRVVVAEATLVGLTVAEHAKNSPSRIEFRALASALWEIIR